MNFDHLKLHALTKTQAATKLREEIDKLPLVNVEAVSAGDVVQNPRGSLFVVVKVPPKRKRFTLRSLSSDWTDTVSADPLCTYRAVPKDLLPYAGREHESLVQEARDAGLDIPKIVQAEYPKLFAEIPLAWIGTSKIDLLSKLAVPASYFVRNPENIRLRIIRLRRDAAYKQADVEHERAMIAFIRGESSATDFCQKDEAIKDCENQIRDHEEKIEVLNHLVNFLGTCIEKQTVRA